MQSSFHLMYQQGVAEMALLGPSTYTLVQPSPSEQVLITSNGNYILHLFKPTSFIIIYPSPFLTPHIYSISNSYLLYFKIYPISLKSSLFKFLFIYSFIYFTLQYCIGFAILQHESATGVKHCNFVRGKKICVTLDNFSQEPSKNLILKKINQFLVDSCFMNVKFDVQIEINIINHFFRVLCDSILFQS